MQILTGTTMKKTFAHHTPSQMAIMIIGILRESFSVLAESLDDACPPSRELAVAHTRLEEAAMWAIKSIVTNDSESAVDV